MAWRLRERFHHENVFEMFHDDWGAYTDHNGIREYASEEAITGSTSTTLTGDTVPRGSLLRTTNVIGRDYLWIAGVSTWESIGGSGEDIGGIKATGYYDFEDAVFEVDDARIFNGITFTAKAATPSAVQWLLVTDEDDVALDDTVLGMNLFNLVAKLNASANGAINIATYTTNATGGHKNATQILTEFDTEGLVGNAYTLDSADDAISTRSAATLTGGVDAIAGYKTYRVNWTQTTTAAPTGTPHLNELGGVVPAFARTSAGLYTITKVGAFPAAKTFLGGAQGSFHDAATKVVSWSAERTSDDIITIRVKETTYTAANDVQIAVKEISAMNTPLIPIEIVVSN